MMAVAKLQTVFGFATPFSLEMAIGGSLLENWLENCIFQPCPFVGFQSRQQKYLQIMDVLCAKSQSEGFPDISARRWLAEFDRLLGSRWNSRRGNTRNRWPALPNGDEGKLITMLARLLGDSATTQAN